MTPTVLHPFRYTPSRRNVRGAVSAVLLAALTCDAPSLAAQAGTTTGVIRGSVRDPAGDPVPGTAIVIQNRETDLLTTVETSSSGTFVRTLLPPGTYDLTVAPATAGFGTERIEGAVLRVGGMLDLTVELRIVVTETVTVVSEAPAVIDTTDVTRSQRIQEDVVDGLPSNGRNYLNLTLLTPGASISQGPDGDELNIGGQRGIFNNFIVDGADFNNPFFGEQRGGQRPAFTFNQDAIEDLVVVNQGATAEFGRSAGGFVNVITKSGTNDFSGSAHYFGQWDEIAAPYSAVRGGGKPDFGRNQAGATLGGPLVRDRAFFFLAYDQQASDETRQATRHVANPANLERLGGFLQTRWPGLFDDEFGPIRRTDDARSLLGKLDLNLDGRHQASFKYNYTWAEQVNGTFDVDSWGASSNGIEGDESNAFNGSLRSLLTNALSNELRIQWAREDRPRWYQGPLLPGARHAGPPQFDALGGRPFPDISMDFADGFRIGLPFFLPIEPSFDTRLQVVDNVSFATGNHLFKAGLEYNRTRAEQQFVGLANGRYIFDSVDGFIGFVDHGSSYVTCSDGSSSTLGVCPAGAGVVGPVLLYLQAATVPGVPAEQLGRQQFQTHELGVFLQDTWHPHDRVTLDLGLRWEGTWHPEVFIEPQDAFFAPYLDDSRFPSDGRIPDDLDNFQPRVGLAWDLAGDGRTVLRANGGSYVARIPMLVFAQHLTTNGAFQQVLFRSSAAAAALGPVPPIDELIDASSAPPFLPDIQVADRNLELPRTWSFSTGAGPRPGTRRGGQRHLRPRADRRPLPLRQPQRPRVRLAVRDRHAPGRRRHQRADRGREQRAVTVQRADPRLARAGRGPQPAAHLRDPLHARLRPLRRRQRTRPVRPPLRQREQPGPGVRLVRPRPAPPGERLSSGDSAGRVATEQRRPLPVRFARLGAVRQPGHAGRPAGGPRLRGRDDPDAQHPAPGQRLSYVGYPRLAPLCRGQRHSHRADPGGLQPDQRRQLRRHRGRIAAVQLRRDAAERVGRYAARAGGAERAVLRWRRALRDPR